MGGPHRKRLVSQLGGVAGVRTIAREEQVYLVEYLAKPTAIR